MRIMNSVGLCVCDNFSFYTAEKTQDNRVHMLPLIMIIINMSDPVFNETLKCKHELDAKYGKVGIWS